MAKINDTLLIFIHKFFQKVRTGSLTLMLCEKNILKLQCQKSFKLKTFKALHFKKKLDVMKKPIGISI